MKELLTCEGLTKSYQKGTNALDNIELHIGFGRIVGLLGPNGSGKTTLIKLANGLLQPTAGSIRIAGMDPGPDTKAIVSYLPDAAWLPDWINYRRSRPLAPNEDTAALDDVVMQVILAEGSATIQELRHLLGFARGRKRRTAPAAGSEEYPEEEKIALDPILTRLQMEARLVIADFEYAVDRHGNPYGWGMARYAAPETLYGPLPAEGTPAESFERLRDHFRRMFPEEPESRLRKLIG